MEKVAILVLAGSDGHSNLGRIVNALEVAKELKEAGDEVKIVFDGAGTEWIAELASGDHKASPLFDAVRDEIARACSFCSKAFGVEAEVKEAGITLLDEFDKHPSVRKYIANDYDVITF